MSMNSSRRCDVRSFIVMFALIGITLASTAPKLQNTVTACEECIVVAQPQDLTVDQTRPNTNTLRKVQYQIFGSGESLPEGFEEMDFDWEEDSTSWGTLPFGENLFCSALSYWNGHSTQWDLTSNLLVRIPWRNQGIENSWMMINLVVDDRVFIYLNGELVGHVVGKDGCEGLNGEQFNITVPMGKIQKGDNVLVIRAEDLGGQSFLNVYATSVPASVQEPGESCDIIKPASETKYASYPGSTLSTAEEELIVAPEFDDEAWMTGSFPFGHNVFCQELTSMWTPEQIEDFPLNSKLVTRNTFSLHQIPTKATAKIIVDNWAKLYVNGNEILDSQLVDRHDCSGISAVSEIDIPTEYLNVDENVIVVVAVDAGGQSFLNVELEAQMGMCQ